MADGTGKDFHPVLAISHRPSALEGIAMTDAKYHTPESGGLEGWVFRPASLADATEAVELAFDYRGDVTLGLRSGQRLVGYVFNRVSGGANPYLDLFPRDQPGMITVLYVDIETIAFSGKDTASGQSWEAWVTKKESDRRAEAERVAADAKARGHL